ncbi:MAG: hypothetical protein ACLQVJ_16870, partial [Syntrophobacteraceae bacterium]
LRPAGAQPAYLKHCAPRITAARGISGRCNRQGSAVAWLSQTPARKPVAPSRNPKPVTTSNFRASQLSFEVWAAKTALTLHQYLVPFDLVGWDPVYAEVAKQR